MRNLMTQRSKNASKRMCFLAIKGKRLVCQCRVWSVLRITENMYRNIQVIKEKGKRFILHVNNKTDGTYCM
jgi:hypothetical protein